jgi:hypothetical protein
MYFCVMLWRQGSARNFLLAGSLYRRNIRRWHVKM